MNFSKVVSIKMGIAKFFVAKFNSGKGRAYSRKAVRSRIHKSKILSSFWKVKYVGLNNLDAEIAKYLDWENGYFIELGASDGIKFSNTLHLELYHGWKGLLIEPSPVEFQELCKNRSKRNSFVNCACVEENFKDETLEVIYSGLMTIDTNEKLGINSPEEHAQIGRGFIDIDTYHFQVRAATLTEVLIECESPSQIDFLSVDVEGSELNVLKGLDLNDFAIKFILIETREKEIIERYLSNFDYNLVDQFSGQDFLFEKICKSEIVPSAKRMIPIKR